MERADCTRSAQSEERAKLGVRGELAERGERARAIQSELSQCARMERVELTRSAQRTRSRGCAGGVRSGGVHARAAHSSLSQCTRVERKTRAVRSALRASILDVLL